MLAPSSPSRSFLGLLTRCSTPSRSSFIVLLSTFKRRTRPKPSYDHRNQVRHALLRAPIRDDAAVDYRRDHDQGGMLGTSQKELLILSKTHIEAKKRQFFPFDPGTQADDKGRQNGNEGQHPYLETSDRTSDLSLPVCVGRTKYALLFTIINHYKL